MSPPQPTSSIDVRDRQAHETSCSVLTGSGHAAVAVIEVRGRDARDCIALRFHAANKRSIQRNEVRFGFWRDSPPRQDAANGESNDSAVEESVVVVSPADDVFEIHCHGGAAAIERIVHDLAAMGVPVVEQTPADYFGQSVDLLIREAAEVLGSCVTERTAAIALDQARGALRDWRESAIERLEAHPESVAEVAQEAASIARHGRFGTRLTDPFRVVLVGPPNVGKSSLLNAIAGFERSITMDLPGTTRDVLATETVLQGWPIHLSDTAGIHAAPDAIEREGVQRARTAIEEADLVILVSEPGGGIPPELPPEKEVVHVLNKADRLEEAIERVEPIDHQQATLQTVAIEGTGVKALLERVLSRLLGELPAAGSPVPVTDRQTRWLSEVAAARDSADMMAALVKARR